MRAFRKSFSMFAAAVISFVAASCALFGDDESGVEESAGALTASVSGSVALSGAVPGALRSSAARTALPSLGEEISYSVEAASGGERPYVAEVDGENLTFSFGELAVVEGGTEYTITATGKSGGVAVVFGEVTETLRPGDAFFCEVPVKPYMKSGTGSVSLEISVGGTEIKSCAIELDGGSVSSCQVDSGGKILFEKTLDSGCYDAVFSFYSTADSSSADGVLLYEFRESVHVCKSLVTDSWFGSSAYITTDGKCVITKALVDKFALSRIYVSSRKEDSKETGTRAEPYKSVARAMNALLDKDTDYTILVDGELTGAQEIPDTLKKDGTGAYKAKSLTISGATGNTTDSLKGGFTSSSNGTTLKILTDVPVTIKNLKITGGYAAQTSAGGGGLYTNGDVTLSEGALVSGNYTASCGGGIYNDSKTLTIEDGAEISGNYEKGGSNCGGGIFNYGGTLVISGGVIKANSADHDGGAIYTKEGTCYIYGNTLIGKDVTAAPGEWYNGSNKAENGGAICVNGGNVYIGYKNNNGTASKDDEASVKVTGNAVKSSSSKGGGIYVAAGIVQIAETSVGFNYSPKDGGGIYTTGTVRLMEDAVIKGNKAYSYGGGVHVNKKGRLSMTSNSIIGGSESGEANTAASGGGVYVASNSTVTGEEATVTFGVLGASVSPSITGNSATSGGGGVYVENFAATFNMNSGSISNNKVVVGTTGGGGVEISYGTFNMNGGTISGNYIENPGTSTLGGAVDINTNGKFNIKGTVSIPYGGEKYKNDVSIRSNSIKITGEITPPEDADSVATIVPSSYTTGVQVLSEAEDSMMIRNYGKYFDISPVSGETWKIDCIMNYGVLVATRVVDSREYFEYKAGDADALKNIFSSLNSMTSEDTGNICITLQDDIDMSSSTDWMPIGFATRALALDENNNPHVVFYGVFDGDGHTITISDNSSPRCYVICRDNKGIIQNLKIKSTGTISFSQAGVWGPNDPATAHCEFCGFCFLNEEGIIRNCWNAIDCDGRGISATGGICSVNRGTVENCINTGSITSMWHTGSGTGAWSGIYMTAGGIAGENSSWDGGMNGVIKNCVNYGTIKGNKRADDSVSLNGIVGAIAGLSNNAGNEIVDCYWRTDCVYSNTSTGTSVSDNLNWMLCKASNRYTSDVRAGTLTGNGSFAANNNGTLAAASADDAGTAQTLQYGTNLLTALNSFVSDNPDDGICEWKSGSSYAAIPECFSDD